MPPPSNVRKISATTTTLTYADDAGAASRRATSGRAIRANTTRPTNYYARGFSGASTVAGAGDTSVFDPWQPAETSFFPALQFFADAIVALPKEVQRQFTQMKEVEAKIHGPNEKLGEMVDELMTYPVPSRKITQTAHVVDGQGLLSFTANNSATGSASASLVNGNAPNAANHSAQNSVSGSVNGEDIVQAGWEENMEKRKKFNELRLLTHNLLPNLDEKNVVLAEANRILSQQLLRLDSVMPHVDNEISEEARLGSMTHWAYSDNRQKKQTGGAAATRRDVAATNSLAAAASAVHESEIAQARRDAGREPVRGKQRGKAREYVDSDFEEKPKKKLHGRTIVEGGITLAERRRLDKGLAQMGLKRSAGGKPVPLTPPKGTPVRDVGKKVAKAKPAAGPVKKKGVHSTQDSPAMASSPLHASFEAAAADAAAAKQQNARLRQNSAATNLRHEKVADDEISRPTSAPSKANGEKTNGKRKAPDSAADHAEDARPRPTMDREESLRQDDLVADSAHASRSTSNSVRAGRGSKTGTPPDTGAADPAAAGMSRTRSTRGTRGNNDESSAEPQAGGHRHKRNHSHLVKQLAPFNRSPDLNRQRHDDMDEDLESVNGRPDDRDETQTSRSPTKRQARSRGNTGNLLAASSPPTYARGDDDAVMEDIEPAEATDDLDDPPELDMDEEEEDDEEDPSTTAGATSTTIVPPLDDDEEDDLDLDEDEDSEPGDPDDPNEPKYCYCNRGSYGEMIACDNEQCPREWFHLGCTGLREPPDEAVKWYCDECKPLFTASKARGKGRGASRK